jgi:Ca2+-binding EF-hand superfamily protein
MGIFEMIGYELSEEETTEILEMLFSKRETITFNNFLDLFKLQLNDLTKDDIKSAFKVLAKDDDQFIPPSLLQEIINEHSGLSPNDALFLRNQLTTYTFENGVDFVQLLDNFDIK